jgi:hypothetical protein
MSSGQMVTRKRCCESGRLSMLTRCRQQRAAICRKWLRDWMVHRFSGDSLCAEVDLDVKHRTTKVSPTRPAGVRKHLKCQVFLQRTSATKRCTPFLSRFVSGGAATRYRPTKMLRVCHDHRHLSVAGSSARNVVGYSEQLSGTDCAKRELSLSRSAIDLARSSRCAGCIAKKRR